MHVHTTKHTYTNNISQCDTITDRRKRTGEQL